MSLIGKILAVPAAVALVLVAIVLTMPPGERPVRTASVAEPAGETVTTADVKEPVPSPGAKSASQEDSTPSPEASQDEAQGSLPDKSSGEVAASEPVVRRYVVMPGDTPATIAKEQLGAASRWTEIARANPGLEARSLQIGQILHLPGAVAPAAKATQTEATPDKQPAAPLASEATGAPLATHRVAQGDSLYQLARKYYGDGSLWTLIRDANPSLTDNGVHGLRLDSELIIPALPGQSH
jgi:nucleoid-associated protein YgaU